MNAVVLCCCWLSLLSVVFVSTTAQSSEGYSYACVPFEGSPATNGKCDSVIDYPNFLLTYPSTYETIDETAYSQTKLLGAVIPVGCRSALITLACYGAFVRCDVTSSGLSVRPPCQSVCLAAVQECEVIFAAMGMADQLPNCSLPSFPSDANVTDPSFCSRPSSSIVVPYNQADCPYPLKYNRDEEDHFAEYDYEFAQICLYPCPSPMWSEAEWIGGIIATDVLSGISFFLSFFVCITLAMLPEKRKYPANMFFWICMSSCLLSASFLFFSFVAGGNTELVCTGGDPPLQVDMDNAGDNDGWGVPCIIQGVFVTFFAMATIFWWAALSINIFMIVFLGLNFRYISKFRIVFHILVWGLALTIVIISLATKSIGSTTGNPFCFSGGGASTSEYYSWMLFYLPLGICLVIVAILLPLSMIRFVQVRFRFRGSNAQKIEQLLRLSLIVLCFVLVFLYTWAYRIYTKVIEDDLSAATEDQVTCSALTGEECSLDKRINLGLWIISLFQFGSQGIIISMCIISKDMIVFWFILLKSCWADPKNAWQIVRQSVSSSSSAHSRTVSRGPSLPKTSVEVSDDL